MSETTSSSSSSVDTTIPVVETVDNIYVTPSVLPCNTIRDTELLAQLPYVGTAIARETIESTNFSNSNISFNVVVNPNEIIDRGIHFMIPELTMKYEAEVGLIREDGGVVQPLDSDQSASLQTGNRSISLATSKISLKNFSSCLQSVTFNGGNGFNVTITDAGILNEILPFYSSESEHIHNPPVRGQKAFQHSIDPSLQYIINSNRKDYYTGYETSPNGIYNLFSGYSPFNQRTSVSESIDVKTDFGAGAVSANSKVLTSLRAKKQEVNISFSNVRFEIPSDIFRSNISLERNGLYGLGAINITFNLDQNRLKTLMVTAGDFASDWNISRTQANSPDVWRLGPAGSTLNFVPVYRFTQFKGISNATPNGVKMYLHKRTPHSAVQEQMKLNSDYFLTYKEYYVASHEEKGPIVRGGGEQEHQSRDITFTTMPSHIIFCCMKTDNRTGELGFARIDRARVAVNSHVTLFDSCADLYNTSQANGYFGTFNEFSKISGSVCCIDTTSLNIGSNILSGESTSVKINVKATCSRIDSGYDWGDGDSNKYQLIVIGVYDKVMAKRGNGFESIEGYQMTDKSKGMMTFDRLSTIVRTPMIYGSGFFSKVWRGIKKLPGLVSKASDIVGKYNPVVGQYAKAASQMLGGRKNSHIVGGASLNSDAHLFMR